MKSQSRWFGRGWAPALGLVALGSLGVACAPHARGKHGWPSASAPTRGITVAGVGKVSAKPDIARTTIGVEVRAGTADEAITQVNARMAQVIAAVKAAGVSAADVRTAMLSLNFERHYEQPPRPVEAPAPTMAPAGAPAGKAKPATTEAAVAVAPPPKLPQGFYTASNSVEVTIRKLDDAGKVISAATAAGADQLFGIRFEVENQTALLVEARQRAVQDAKERAAKLAQLAGVKLGSAVSITEVEGGQGGGPMPMFAAAKMAEAAPIERGELTLVTTVQIVYELGD